MGTIFAIARGLPGKNIVPALEYERAPRQSWRHRRRAACVSHIDSGRRRRPSLRATKTRDSRAPSQRVGNSRAAAAFPPLDSGGGALPVFFLGALTSQPARDASPTRTSATYPLGGLLVLGRFGPGRRAAPIAERHPGKNELGLFLLKRTTDPAFATYPLGGLLVLRRFVPVRYAAPIAERRPKKKRVWPLPS